MSENAPPVFTLLNAEARRQFWKERYATGTTGWDRGVPNPALLSWLESGVLAPCRILVPGCGRGHEVVELARRGFDVVAVDYAEQALAAAKAQLGRHELSATLLDADLLTFSPPLGFDAIYEQAALCALAPETWASYAHRLYTWLQPEGRLFALFMQTGRDGGPPFHCDLVRMRELFPESKWGWPEVLADPVAHPSGLHELAVILTRRPST